MHKSATKCNETVGKWCKNKHGASKIIDTFETYQRHRTPHHHHHSLLHNLAKLIARDKVVSIFGIVLANHLRGCVGMQFGCSKVKGF
jgi:hypothetical protein